MPTKFFEDTFNGTNGTSLSAHTSDSGHTWIGAGSPTWSDGWVLSNVGSVYSNPGAGASNSRPAILSPVSDYRVLAVIKWFDTSASYPIILSRMSSDAQNWYGLYFIGSAGSFQFYKSVAGTTSFIGGFSAPSSIGSAGPSTEVEIELIIEGSEITINVNGEEAATYTDTDVAGPGYVGISSGSSTGNAIAGGSHIALLEAYTIVDIINVDDYDVDNPAIYWSPQWFMQADGDYVKCTNTGAYMKCKFQGSEFGMVFDTSSLVAGSVAAGSYPIIKWSLDGKPWQEVTLTSSMNPLEVRLASGLGVGEDHDILVVIKGMDFQIDKWTTPVNAVKVNSIKLAETTGSFVTQTIREKTALFVGDSITEGINLGAGNNLGATNQDATRTWSWLVADSFQWEFAIMGYGSQTFNQGGGGNVPATQLAVGYLWSGQAHDMTGYDYIVSLYGTGIVKDTPTGVFTKTHVVTWLTALRAGAPTAHILVVLPTCNSNHEILIEAVSDMDDPKIETVGPLPNVEGLDYVRTTKFYNDTIHPTAEGHARIAAQLVPLIKDIVDPSGGGGGGVGGSPLIGEI